MPTQLPQHSLPQSAAVSSCRWQVVYESFLTFCEPILKRSANCWRPVMTSSLEVTLCFPLELDMKLAIGTAFLKICWIWVTSSYQLPSKGHRMRWHHLKARKAGRGSANEWLAGWNCRWTSFATWQAGENRRTPELKSVQRTPAILKEGHLWFDFRKLAHHIHMWKCIPATSSLTPQKCAVFHAFMISQHQLWKSVAKSMWNLDFRWISPWMESPDPSRGSTATWR